MRERVELLVGRRTRAMWVMTFHAACARMLRADGDKLGYTRQFTIYDQADSRRLVKRCLDELGVDTKRYTPGAVHHQISDAKNKLRDAEAYKQLVGSYFEQTVADAFDALRARAAPHERDGLRRPARQRRQRPAALPGGPRPLLAAPFATSSSTSTRTRTPPSTAGCSCSPASTATSRSSATTRSAWSRARCVTMGDGTPAPDRGRPGGRRGPVRATAAATFAAGRVTDAFDVGPREGRARSRTRGGRAHRLDPRAHALRRIARAMGRCVSRNLT